jgi:hypothetical protein
MFGFYSMNAFEILLWAGAAYVVVVLLADEQPRFWLLFGLLVGIGLQNKHTFVLFAAGWVLGLLLHRRSAFPSRWLWLGGLLALIIFLPNLVWQVQHDWPTLEFYAGAAGKNIASSPVDVLLDQLLTMNPLLLAVWLLGLAWLLRSRTFRPLAWSYLVPLLLLMFLGSSRPDRLAPAYVPLFATGAVGIEQLTRRRAWRWLPAAAAVLVLVSAGVTAPLGLPLLPPEDQEKAAIFTSNYGEAGAIHFYGRDYGLPEPISGHNNYWMWGPGRLVRGGADCG